MTQQTRIWATGPSGEVLPVVCDAQGNLVIQLEGATVNVGDVDVLSSALPTGAATAVNQQPAATTITIDSITLTAANTEYSKAIVTGCKKLTFRCVDSTKIAAGNDIRYAFETDKVHDATLPFMLLDGGAVYSESDLNLTGKTLYVAGVTAGDIVQIEMWS